MVNKKRELFVCEDCGMNYKDRTWAEKCEKFCRKNKSCDLNIIKHAVKK